jgi:hypothetical protein
VVAWLITMVPCLPEEEVVTVLNPRMSSSRVGAIMERLYIERREGLNSLLEYTKTGKARCPWKFSTNDGVPWSDDIWCGSGDRYFRARKVDNLRVVVGAGGHETLVWTERKPPDLSGLKETLGHPRPDAQ